MEKIRHIYEKEVQKILRYLNEKEVARILGLSVATLRNWRHLRKGPNYVILGSRSVRYEITSVLKFAEERHINLNDHGEKAPIGGLYEKEDRKDR